MERDAEQGTGGEVPFRLFSSSARRGEQRIDMGKIVGAIDI